MIFLIALATIVAASSAYLLWQFWSRSLAVTDEPPAAADTPASGRQRDVLKAA